MPSEWILVVCLLLLLSLLLLLLSLLHFVSLRCFQPCRLLALMPRRLFVLFRAFAHFVLVLCWALGVCFFFSAMRNVRFVNGKARNVSSSSSSLLFFFISLLFHSAFDTAAQSWGATVHARMGSRCQHTVAPLSCYFNILFFFFLSF